MGQIGVVLYVCVCVIFVIPSNVGLSCFGKIFFIENAIPGFVGGL